MTVSPRAIQMRNTGLSNDRHYIYLTTGDPYLYDYFRFLKAREQAKVKQMEALKEKAKVKKIWI